MLLNMAWTYMECCFSHMASQVCKAITITSMQLQKRFALISEYWGQNIITCTSDSIKSSMSHVRVPIKNLKEKVPLLSLTFSRT